MQSLIHITDKQSGLISDYILEKYYWNDVRTIELENNRDTFDFTTLANRSFSRHISAQNHIVIPDRKVGYAEFIIDESNLILNSGGDHHVDVYASASYLRLKKAKIIFPQTTGADTATKHVQNTLADTGWYCGRVAHTGLRKLTIDEHTNPYALLKRISFEFNLELQFRISIENNKIVRYVDMLERIGRWRGFEATFGRNLLEVERKSKSNGVITALLGLSPADSNGNVKTSLQYNESALQRWGTKDSSGQLKHLYGLYYPESTEEDMSQEKLDKLTEDELNKRLNETIEYKTDIATLSKHIGNEVFIGDTLRVKDEKFDPPIYVEARVHKSKGSIKEEGNTSIVLGDYVEFSQDEVMSVWRNFQKQIAMKIEEAQLRDYTYSKLTIDDKDEIVFENGKTFAELQGRTAEENANFYAENVAEEAESSLKSYADVVSGQALIDAQNYAVAQTVYDNKMTEIASDLAEKSSIEYVEGQLMDKVNVGDAYTIEEMDNVLLNKVSITQYQTDMDGIVQDISSNSTLIGQNQDAIALKADSSRVDTVAGIVDDHSATLSVQADQIASKVEASYVEGAIAGIDVGGRNYFVIAEAMEDKILSWSNGRVAGEVGSLLSGYIECSVGDKFSCNYQIDQLMFYNADQEYAGALSYQERFTVPDENYNYPYGPSTLPTDKVPAFFRIVFRSDFLNGRPKEGVQVMLAKGDKATDWTPAPEDVQADIDVVLNYATTEITQLADEIELRVEKNGVISAINLSSESAIIQSEKINLVGAVNVLSDITGNLGTINAGTINGVNINGSTFNSITDSRNYTTIENNHIHSEGDYWDDQFGNVYGIFDVENGAITMKTAQINADGSRRPVDVIASIRASGISVTNSTGGGTYMGNGGDIGFGDWFDGNNRNASIFLMGDDLVFDANGKIVFQTEIGSTLRMDGVHYIETNAIDHNGSGAYLYLRSQPGAGLRATEVGTTSNFVPFQASSFDVRSLAENKQDIALWEDNALNIIKQSDLYQYRYINDAARGDETMKYGYVIGEGYHTPSMLLNAEGDAISQSAMNSLSIKGIQELLGITDDHADRINYLEMVNQVLKQKVAKLEEAS
ncbi:phage tail spike protein [Paraliobacillus ryukyuensis]|uniref:phage tail spike protein n=1 Tax=Paraliobacillus ryukyuensis TaxID=200904 RepID=UPI0015C4C566|nr:phage tail spike protein [Paraliobacillus ryukyuensis]